MAREALGLRLSQAKAEQIVSLAHMALGAEPFEPLAPTEFADNDDGFILSGSGRYKRTYDSTAGCTVSIGECFLGVSKDDTGRHRIIGYWGDGAAVEFDPDSSEIVAREEDLEPSEAAYIAHASEKLLSGIMAVLEDAI